MKVISKYFFNGLIVIVPIAITIFVIVEIFSFTETLLGRHLPIQFPGIGLITVLGLILLVGWLSSYWILQRLISFGESLLNRIPFVKFIYNSVKHLSTAVFESNNLFNEAVLVPYPHEGAKAIGFIMSELSEPLKEKLDGDYVCVFVPWSLNMTSGTNLIVPRRDVISLDISSESALQYILTAGTVMPRHEGEDVIAEKITGVQNEK
ncbi:DUF502 domain-containing protein [Anaerosinus massiliensis]|uniref:DUF502 domain-containing protein n=1 Tax=Massilibacillus massiliensis TaxID=1806837 RepID=UPI000DA61BCE|nr:DUF502 domain-containing protein [Massilibacillus massiliensis]